MRCALAVLLGSGIVLGGPARGAEPAGLPEFEPPPAGTPVRWAAPRGRSALIRAAPRRGAGRLGEVRAGAEVVVTDDEGPSGGGCGGWLRVLPAGYLCQDEVRLRRGPFPGTVAPAMVPAGSGDRGAPPYRYALVRSERSALYPRPSAAAAPAQALHRGDGLTLVGKSVGIFVKTASHLWVPRGDLEIAEPTRLRGLELAALSPDRRFRMGWLVPDRGAAEVPLLVPARLAGPEPAQEVRLAARYTPVEIVRLPGRGRAVVLAHLPEGPLRAEVDVRHLRRVLPSPPPPDLGPGERWIDVNVGEQVAVAYEGTAPVFAALVSTAPHGGTPLGSYAVYRKYRYHTMANVAGARAQYDFRRVPHAQFFHGRFGLHATLWHDLLGHPVSHGCVNLSPADAERLFGFTAPTLPPGWHALNGDHGTRIIVHR